jgi:hypothetical protein
MHVGRRTVIRLQHPLIAANTMRSFRLSARAGNAARAALCKEDDKAPLWAGDLRQMDEGNFGSLELANGFGQSRWRGDTGVEHGLVPEGPDVPELTGGGGLMPFGQQLEVCSGPKRKEGGSCGEAVVPGERGFKIAADHMPSLPELC